MSDTTGNQPQHFQVDASPVNFEVMVGAVEVHVIPADKIEVEDAENLKYLRLKNGDFQLPQAVFLTIEGRRMEITLDAIPEDPQP